MGFKARDTTKPAYIIHSCLGADGIVYLYLSQGPKRYLARLDANQQVEVICRAGQPGFDKIVVRRGEYDEMEALVLHPWDRFAQSYQIAARTRVKLALPPIMTTWATCSLDGTIYLLGFNGEVASYHEDKWQVTQLKSSTHVADAVMAWGRPTVASGGKVFSMHAGSWVEILTGVAVDRLVFDEKTDSLAILGSDKIVFLDRDGGVTEHAFPHFRFSLATLHENELWVYFTRTVKAEGLAAVDRDGQLQQVCSPLPAYRTWHGPYKNAALYSANEKLLFVTKEWLLLLQDGDWQTIDLSARCAEAIRVL